MPGPVCPRRKHWVRGPSFLFASWFPVGRFLPPPFWAKKHCLTQSHQRPAIMDQSLWKCELPNISTLWTDFLRCFATVVESRQRQEKMSCVVHTLTQLELLLWSLPTHLSHWPKHWVQTSLHFFSVLSPFSRLRTPGFFISSPVKVNSALISSLSVLFCKTSFHHSF